MVAATDQRKNVLGIVNEVRRKLNTSQVTVLTDTLSTALVDYLNDVISEVADFGNWEEMQRVVSAACVVSASVSDYTIQTSALIQNIHELVYGASASSVAKQDVAPMRLWTKDDLRRVNRSRGTGRPRFWTVYGTDSNSNPAIKIYPTPSSSESNKQIEALIYVKPNLISTASGSAVPVFPSRLLVQGLYSKALLDESGGQPTQRYQATYVIFRNMVEEAYNRYNGDTGSDTRFRPGYGATY